MCARVRVCVSESRHCLGNIHNHVSFKLSSTWRYLLVHCTEKTSLINQQHSHCHQCIQVFFYFLLSQDSITVISDRLNISLQFQCSNAHVSNTHRIQHFYISEQSLEKINLWKSVQAMISSLDLIDILVRNTKYSLSVGICSRTSVICGAQLSAKPL